MNLWRSIRLIDDQEVSLQFEFILKLCWRNQLRTELNPFSPLHWFTNANQNFQRWMMKYCAHSPGFYDTVIRRSLFWRNFNRILLDNTLNSSLNSIHESIYVYTTKFIVPISDFLFIFLFSFSEGAGILARAGRKLISKQNRRNRNFRI